MARLAARVRAQAEVSRAAALLPTAPAEARQRLLMLAGQPDPSGGIAADVIRALGDAGDQAGAADAARVAGVTNRAAPARLAIAGALLAVGQEAESAAMASQMDQATLTPAQRRDLAALQTGSAVRASDRLNEAGDQAAAFERLRPALASGAGADAELALARLYQGARQPAEAMRISGAVLARDPRNWVARRGAVDAAVAAGDRRQAERLAAEGRAMAPTDSRATLLSARVARAFGSNAQAQTLLRLAAVQRREELGDAAPPAASHAGGLANPFQSASAGAAPAGPAARPGDPVSREIAEQLALVHNDTAPRALGNASVRVRSGTAGLDQLQELSATAQASFQAGKLGGRVTARVMPVFLDAGKLSSAGDAPLRFGTNALMSAPASSSSSATGAGLNVAYQQGDWISADVGTSPLGFPVTNLLGGVEIAPKLTDAVRLRVRGERRSVLDSLLSYAGVKDGATGQTWGGVTQTGGHVQLESRLGEGGVYAGGGYAAYDGQHVAHNVKLEAGAGFSYPVYRDRDGELTTGLDLIYFAFDNNQRGFTLGQGGYFSPQSFVALNVPLYYKSKLGDLRYRIGGTVGYASFREDASPLFPNDPGRQAQVEAAARFNSAVPTRNQAQTRSGFVGGVRVDLDYPLSDALTLGSKLQYDKAANWNETRVGVQLENRF